MSQLCCRLSHLRNGSGRPLDGDPSVRRSKRLRHEEPESPSTRLQRKQDLAQSKSCKLADSSAQQASQGSPESKQYSGAAPRSKLEAGSAAPAISMHCIAGSSQVRSLRPQALLSI